MHGVIAPHARSVSPAFLCREQNLRSEFVLRMACAQSETSTVTADVTSVQAMHADEKCHFTYCRASMFPLVSFIIKSRFAALIATQRSRCPCVGGATRHTKLQTHCRRLDCVPLVEPKKVLQQTWSQQCTSPSLQATSYAPSLV